jgi:hypothetical protein
MLNFLAQTKDEEVTSPLTVSLSPNPTLDPPAGANNNRISTRLYDCGSSCSSIPPKDLKDVKVDSSLKTVGDDDAYGTTCYFSNNDVGFAPKSGDVNSVPFIFSTSIGSGSLVIAGSRENKPSANLLSYGFTVKNTPQVSLSIGANLRGGVAGSYSQFMSLFSVAIKGCRGMDVRLADFHCLILLYI